MCKKGIEGCEVKELITVLDGWKVKQQHYKWQHIKQGIRFWDRKFSTADPDWVLSGGIGSIENSIIGIKSILWSLLSKLIIEKIKFCLLSQEKSNNYHSPNNLNFFS